MCRSHYEQILTVELGYKMVHHLVLHEFLQDQSWFDFIEESTNLCDNCIKTVVHYTRLFYCI
jgi:hypothetical protein